MIPVSFFFHNPDLVTVSSFLHKGTLLAMNNQISKDMKFKDLPDEIKLRLVALTRRVVSLFPSPCHPIPDFSSVVSKIRVLGLDSLRNLFDQSVTNCETFKEGYELRPEDVRQNIERDIRNLNEHISLFRESQDDSRFLHTMHEAIRLLRRRYESTRS